MEYAIFLASLVFLAWATKGFFGAMNRHEALIRSEDFGKNATYRVERCGDDNQHVNNWQDTERRGSGR